MASSVCRLPAAPAAPQRAAFRGTAAPGSRPASLQARRVAARVAPPGGAAGSTASAAADVSDLRRDLQVAIQVGKEGKKEEEGLEPSTAWHRAAAGHRAGWQQAAFLASIAAVPALALPACLF